MPVWWRQFLRLQALYRALRLGLNDSYQAAARLVEREAGAFFSGGRSRSAGTWKRARSLCTIAILSPFLPQETR